MDSKAIGTWASSDREEEEQWSVHDANPSEQTITLQDGLIAINYAARALGVTRHMRVMQAMHHCPELKCIHVQTLGGETGQEGVAGPVNSGITHPNSRSLQKACLERYRRASAEIIALIQSILPQAPLEKASIDEVYVDVTALVEKELAEREDAAVSEHAEMDTFAWGSVVEGGPLNPENEYDRRLSVGANIACRLRGAIQDKLGFTSSAGIAHTKMVAKVGSARNKPNQQTLIAARGIAGLMESLPLRKLRYFGGKLGVELEALGASTAGQQHFGDRAKWIMDCVTGQHNEPVTVRDLSKSMLAAKTFEATSDTAALERWLSILADELSDRMIYDAQINQRYPRLLVLSYRQIKSPAGRSKSCTMPKAPPPGPTAAMLTEAAMSLLQKCSDATPCCHLGLTATEFQEAPGDEQGCITRFFQSKDKNAFHGSGRISSGGSHFQPVQKPRSGGSTIEGLFKKAGKQNDISSGCQSFETPSSQDHISSAKDDMTSLQSCLVDPGLEVAARTEDHQEQAEPICTALWRANPEGSKPTNSTSPREPSHESLQYEGLSQASPDHDMSRTAHSPMQDSKSQEDTITLNRSDLQSRCTFTSSVHVEQARADRIEQIEEDLEGVDLEEQKKILREIWIRKSAGSAPPNSRKRTSSADKEKLPKQPKLTDLFARRI